MSKRDRLSRQELHHEDREFQMDLRSAASEFQNPPSKHPNYGVRAFLLLLGAGVLFYFGLTKAFPGLQNLLASSFGGDGEDSGAYVMDINVGVTLVLIGFCVLIFSLTSAGASIATKRAGFLGVFVIIVSILPFLCLISVIWFGMPADINIMPAPENPEPAIPQTKF